MSINRVIVNGKTYIIKGGTYSTVFNGKVYSDGEVYLDGERIYCKKPWYSMEGGIACKS